MYSLSEVNNHNSFMKAILDYQYKMPVYMTYGLSSNTVPLTVQFRTPDTDERTYNVQTDEELRDLSALNCDVGDSSVLQRDES
jgi:hypothetical protein